jgi:hypothetical protein
MKRNLESTSIGLGVPEGGAAVIAPRVAHTPPFSFVFPQIKRCAEPHVLNPTAYVGYGHGH